MNNEIVIPTLAERRDALVAECSMQRGELSHHVAGLRLPAQGALGFSLASMKVPLMIAGVVLGMVAVKPSRALPLLATGLSLFKVARSVLGMVRGAQSVRD